MLLLDTNIVSFLFKRDSRFVPYQEQLRGQTLAIAFVTVGELYKWPLERNWGEERRRALESLIHGFAVLPYDDQLARTWAELMAAGKRAGRVPNFADSWIAATALRHGLALVTHNAKHFQKVAGLKIITAVSE